MSTTFIETGHVPTPPQNKSVWARLMTKLNLNAMMRAALRQRGDERGSIITLSELASRGLTDFQLSRNETKQLVEYLRDNEHVKAAIHGHVPNAGGALMVATGQRLLYLHDSPSFTNFEDISYDVVDWVSINRSGRLLSTVSLQTKFKHYQIEHVNPHQAELFINYLELQIPKSSRSTVHVELMCIA